MATGERKDSSTYSLAEVRLMLEIDNMEKCTLARLTSRLNIDKGLASRLIGRLADDGIILKERSSEDKRVDYLSLTERGRRTFSELDAKSDAQIGLLIENLTQEEREKLAASMDFISMCLDKGRGQLNIRLYRQDDVAYVISRHKEIYRRDYGFSTAFSDYVEKTVKAFHEGFKAGGDMMWIAEQEGKPAGAIAIVRVSETTAQLRWFFVEPEARGRGVGGTLIDTALAFCREKGYGSVILWTVNEMKSARRIYAARGFTLAETKANDTWTDRALTEEKWKLAL